MFKNIATAKSKSDAYEWCIEAERYRIQGTKYIVEITFEGEKRTICIYDGQPCVATFYEGSSKFGSPFTAFAAAVELKNRNLKAEIRDYVIASVPKYDEPRHELHLKYFDVNTPVDKSKRKAL
jgi:hypothetical protein